MRVEPIHYIWWLVSRSAGVVALGMVSVSVLIGLAMATRIVSSPSLRRRLPRLHEHVALVALSAIALHGLSLLGDSWLHAGWRGLLIPFDLHYRPLYTGLGIIAGYLAALLGPSFYLRRRIGTALWRRLHRATVAVWILGVVHTLGAGTDGAALWMRAVLLLTGAPIVFLVLLRVLGYGRSAGSTQPARSITSSSTDARSRSAADPVLSASAPRASS